MKQHCNRLFCKPWSLALKMRASNHFLRFVINAGAFLAVKMKLRHPCLICQLFFGLSFYWVQDLLAMGQVSERKPLLPGSQFRLCKYPGCNCYSRKHKRGAQSRIDRDLVPRNHHSYSKTLTTSTADRVFSTTPAFPSVGPHLIETSLTATTTGNTWRRLGRQ